MMLTSPLTSKSRQPRTLARHRHDCSQLPFCRWPEIVVDKRIQFAMLGGVQTSNATDTCRIPLVEPFANLRQLKKVQSDERPQSTPAPTARRAKTSREMSCCAKPRGGVLRSTARPQELPTNAADRPNCPMEKPLFAQASLRSSGPLLERTILSTLLVFGFLLYSP
jgi:hypothetical protein